MLEPFLPVLPRLARDLGGGCFWKLKKKKISIRKILEA